jgi:cytochrome c-type biogenesis protein CcmH
MKRMPWFILLLAMLGLTITTVRAQTPLPRPVTDDQVNAIAKQLYCPVCENIPLDVCPTQACAEWRELIRAKLAEGRSPEWIKNYFAQQYGDRVLAQPPARGLNWLVYILPWVAILGGVFILYRAFRTWKQPGAENDPVQVGPVENAGSASDDKYFAQLEDELRKKD